MDAKGVEGSCQIDNARCQPFKFRKKKAQTGLTRALGGVDRANAEGKGEGGAGARARGADRKPAPRAVRNICEATRRSQAVLERVSCCGGS